jgi:hypothetical protein
MKKIEDYLLLTCNSGPTYNMSTQKFEESANIDMNRRQLLWISLTLAFDRLALSLSQILGLRERI